MGLDFALAIKPPIHPLHAIHPDLQRISKPLGLLPIRGASPDQPKD